VRIEYAALSCSRVVYWFHRAACASLCVQVAAGKLYFLQQSGGPHLVAPDVWTRMGGGLMHSLAHTQGEPGGVLDLKRVGQVREEVQGRVKIILRQAHVGPQKPRAWVRDGLLAAAAAAEGGGEGGMGGGTEHVNGDGKEEVEREVLVDMRVGDFEEEELRVFLGELSGALEEERASFEAHAADELARHDLALAQGSRVRNTVESRVRLLHLALATIDQHITSSASLPAPSSAGNRRDSSPSGASTDASASSSAVSAGDRAGGVHEAVKKERKFVQDETAPLFDVMGGDSHLLLCSQSYLVKIAAEHGARYPISETVPLRHIAYVTSAEGLLHLQSKHGVPLLILDPTPFEAVAFSTFMTRLNRYLGLAGMAYDAVVERTRENERDRTREEIERERDIVREVNKNARERQENDTARERPENERGEGGGP